MTNYVGTPKNDTITIPSGTAADKIIGLAGNDKLTSHSGDTALYGDVVEDVIINFSSLSSTSATVYDMKNVSSGSFGTMPQFGNDTLTAFNGSNKMYGDAVNYSIHVHGTDSLAAGVSAPVVVVNLSVSFGNDILNGHGELFGDLDTFSVSIIAGSGGDVGSSAVARIGILGAAGQSGLSVQFGNDQINAMVGDNLIYGDAKNYNVTLISGSDSVGADARARLDESKVTFGSDKITAGEGLDLIYADVQNFNMTLTTGDNASNNRAQDLTDYIFGNDEVNAGGGDNRVYGDAQVLLWNFHVGSGIDGTGNNVGLSFARWTSAIFAYGHDKITAGDGANWIYGDVQDWTINSSGGEESQGINQLSLAGLGNTDVTPQTAAKVVFGNDQVIVGDGNNHIFGDANSFQTIVVGPENPLTTSLLENGLFLGNLSFGKDIISAGNGSNIVYGDVNQLIESYVSGNGAAPGATAFILRAQFDFTFGSDTISVGSGGNLVYGDAGSYLMYYQSGDFVSGGVANGIRSLDFDYTTTSAASVYGSKTTFGIDHITSGSGNDSLVGDVGTFTMDFHAGQHLDGSTGPAEVISGIGVFNDIAEYPFLAASPDLSPVTFGNDEIHGGGGIDHIYGEGIVFNISAIGGSIDTPYTGDPTFINPNTGNTLAASVATLDVRAGLGSGAPVTAGNDSLYGNAGNDVIYGDWQNLSILLQDGQGTGLSTIPERTEAYIDTFKLGDDVLIGGSGNDVLYGDVANLEFLHLDGMGNLITDDILDPDSNVQHFIAGNNILYGGAGDDVITGGTTGLDADLGHNLFVYDGNIVNGDDQILDFHVGFDTLVGQNGATFTNGGLVGGNLVINVDDAGVGSTITLMNVHVDIFASIMQSHAAVV